MTERATASETTCPRCGGPAHEGFAAVALDGTATPLFWVGGPLERERLTGGARLEGRERRPVRALRCGDCGAVELRA